MFVRKRRRRSRHLARTSLLQKQSHCFLLRLFFAAFNCHICNQPLGSDKVRDLCHNVVIYRGYAHNRCNLMYRISKSCWQLPVVIRNLKGWRSISPLLWLASIYRPFPIHSSRSIQPREDPRRFKYVRESFATPEFGRINREDIYPYDYMDSFARLDESRLPSQDAFFNKFSDSPCSDAEYAHATRVWTLGLYLKCDVLLLADFF